MAQGYLPQAQALLGAALHCHQRRLGAGHAYTARSLLRVGQLCAALGEREAAHWQISQALAIYTAALGAAHPYTEAAQRAYAQL